LRCLVLRCWDALLLEVFAGDATSSGNDGTMSTDDRVPASGPTGNSGVISMLTTSGVRKDAVLTLCLAQ
jgi:hypothetical protein